MKKITVMLSLLFTAILCFVLSSCDSQTPQTEESSSTVETTEETSTANGSFADETSAQESSTANITSTSKAPSETTDTTKPAATTAATSSTASTASTTAAVTSKPTTTTAKSTTTKPAATKPVAAPPVTTTVPSTTLPIESNGQTGSLDVSISDSEDTDFETQIIKAVNDERKSRALPELSYSAELSEAAKIRAKEISVSYGHFRPDNSWWRTVSELAMGENIAKGQASPYDVMAEWMLSDGYRENILSTEYKTIGVGYYYDSNTDTYYWVQIFGI